ncbi:hypothetical protein BC937DRAFT_87443 [Endogone sp. FLAS-F59071]|nr:hypothetical protein BC937DRAFT_87443 [Endogone sp. FLAS-F59071]|eukprot:RUS12602.1 hypothetical protein BC937DRAFT_87443 [Endogone sp. FLAS-F59071]
MNPGGLPMQVPLAVPSTGRGNIIVLNNEKPSRNSPPPIISTPPIVSTLPIVSTPDSTRHDSGYSRDVKKPLFGFRIGYDGGVSELDQRDADVELGLGAAQVAAETERQYRYETDSGVAEWSG